MSSFLFRTPTRAIGGSELPDRRGGSAATPSAAARGTAGSPRGRRGPSLAVSRIARRVSIVLCAVGDHRERGDLGGRGLRVLGGSSSSRARPGRRRRRIAGLRRPRSSASIRRPRGRRRSRPDSTLASTRCRAITSIRLAIGRPRAARRSSSDRRTHLGRAAQAVELDEDRRPAGEQRGRVVEPGRESCGRASEASRSREDGRRMSGLRSGAEIPHGRLIRIASGCWGRGRTRRPARSRTWARSPSRPARRSRRRRPGHESTIAWRLRSGSNVIVRVGKVAPHHRGDLAGARAERRDVVDELAERVRGRLGQLQHRVDAVRHRHERHPDLLADEAGVRLALRGGVDHLGRVVARAAARQRERRDEAREADRAEVDAGLLGLDRELAVVAARSSGPGSRSRACCSRTS